MFSMDKWRLCMYNYNCDIVRDVGDVWKLINTSREYGLIICDKGMVGMGAVIIRGVPPGATVLGNSAKE